MAHNPFHNTNSGLLFSNFANQGAPFNSGSTNLLPFSMQNYNVPQFNFSNAAVNTPQFNQINPQIMAQALRGLGRAPLPLSNNIANTGGVLKSVAETALPKVGGMGLSKVLGGVAKVGGFLANPLVGAGIGLLGGLIGARKAAKRRTSNMPSGMSNLAQKLESPDISEFRDIAREAAPSQQDLMRIAAATGGSQASATAQAMGGQTRAMDQALRAFQQQERANQGLLANMYSQQFGAMQQDQAFRRQTGVDIFSNIANLGAGILGQGYGNRSFTNRQNQMGGY